MKQLAISLMCLALTTTVFGALDTGTVERVTGLKGSWNEKEGVFKVSQPRTDVKVTVDGWAMPPFMGLSSWAAFTEGKGASAMVMGDLVLFQDEVNTVMSALLENGLAVTALHNHFFYDEPKVYFMHIGGEGSADKLATGVRQALDKLKEIRAALPQPPAKFGGDAIPEKSAINAEPLQKILSVKGQSKDGMFKAVIGRKTKMPCDCEVGQEMGVNTWAAFAGSDDNAIVDGDFAVHEDELQSVLKSPRHAGISIVAIHQHMTGEMPRILFLHYWGKRKAEFLAKGIKAALQTQERP
jgi:hypothetical protein